MKNKTKDEDYTPPTDKDGNIIADSDLYFADYRRKPSDVAASIIQRIEDQRNARSFLMRRWHRNYCYYHNYYFDQQGSSEINYSNIFFTGEQGETISFSVNHFKNIADHMYNIITGTKTAYNTLSMNSDENSRQQTRLAEDILNYDLYHYNLEDKMKRCVRDSIMFDAAYLKVYWDHVKGKIILPAETEDDVDVYEGEPAFEVINNKDVYYDANVRYFYDNQHLTIGWLRNMHDLIAQFPDKEEDIRASSPHASSSGVNQALQSADKSTYDTDQVEVFEFFHKPTAAMESGRYMLMTANGTTLLDHELEVDFIPVFQVSSGDDLMLQSGYSVINDIAGPQGIINAQYSAIASNHENLGIPVILIPSEANISVEALQGNYNGIKYDGDKEPKTLQLMQDDAQIFEFIKLLELEIETLSGINATTRGQVNPSDASGIALALMNQQSLEYLNPLQDSYVRFQELVGLAIIKLYQTFATTDRIIKIAGKNRITAAKSFKGSDIDGIDEVRVTIGNPIANTLSGRIMLAEYILKIPNIKYSFSALVSLLEDGDMSELIDKSSTQMLLIEKENEMILQGKNPPVSFVDDDAGHILGHSSVLNDPSYRNANDPVFKAGQQHILDHLTALNDQSAQQLKTILGFTPGQPGAPEPNQHKLPNIPNNMSGSNVVAAPNSSPVQPPAMGPLRVPNVGPSQPGLPSALEQNPLPNPIQSEKNVAPPV